MKRCSDGRRIFCYSCFAFTHVEWEFVNREKALSVSVVVAVLPLGVSFECSAKIQHQERGSPLIRYVNAVVVPTLLCATLYFTVVVVDT